MTQGKQLMDKLLQVPQRTRKQKLLNSQALVRQHVKNRKSLVVNLIKERRREAADEISMTALKTTRYESAGYLIDKRSCSEYLNAALEDGNHSIVRLALKKTLRASNVQMHLPKNDAIRLDTMIKALNAIGLRLTVVRSNSRRN